MDDIGKWGLLIVAAFAAGVLNSIAGGGTLLTFPALMRFGGLSSVLANATSTVALVPGSLAGAWGFRRYVYEARQWVLLLLVPSIVGGAIGSLLVTRLPGHIFDLLVPWLLLIASVLFLLQPTLRRIFPPHKEGLPSRRGATAIIGFQLLVSIYGGYFGAGIGILMLSSLGLMGVGDIHHMNGVKTVLAAMINVMSVVVFVIDDKVVWQPALGMMIGSIAGGFAGAKLGQLLPKNVVRWFVILLGLGLAIYYFVKMPR